MIGLAEQQSWSHIAWDCREVGTIVPVEHLLGAGCSYNGYERVVVIGMTSVKPVGNAVDLILAEMSG